MTDQREIQTHNSGWSCAPHIPPPATPHSPSGPHPAPLHNILIEIHSTKQYPDPAVNSCCGLSSCPQSVTMWLIGANDSHQKNSNSTSTITFIAPTTLSWGLQFICTIPRTFCVRYYYISLTNFLLV